MASRAAWGLHYVFKRLENMHCNRNQTCTRIAPDCRLSGPAIIFRASNPIQSSPVPGFKKLNSRELLPKTVGEGFPGGNSICHFPGEWKRKQNA